jgi:hypothetical protein
MRALAPRWAAYTLRMGNPPGPLMGTSLRGGVFLPDAMPGGRQIIEMAFGADLTADPATWAWYDVTALVLWDPGVNIPNVGRGDERSKASPAQCSFTLKNPTGDFTPGNVGSRFFPNVKLNTPVRCSLDLGNGESVRFQGECSNGFAPRWDTSRRFAVCDVVASGVKRRIGQGQSPIVASIANAVAAGPTPIASWLMQDGSGATAAISAIAGAPSLSAIGNTTLGNTPSPTLPGTTTVASQPVPSGSVGPALVGYLPAYTDTGYLAIDMWFNLFASTAVSTGHELMAMRMTTGTFGGTLGQVDLDTFNELDPPAGFFSHITDTVFTPIAPTMAASGTSPYTGQWINAFLTWEQVGPDIQATMTINGVLVASQTWAGQVLGRAWRLNLNNQPGSTGTGIIQWGPCNIWNSKLATNTYQAGIGYAGELCTTRMQRLCAQKGVTIDIVGTSVIPMGPMSAGTFTALLDECADADGGLLLDGLTSGYTYVCLNSIMNQDADLTLIAGQLAPPFKPAPGDQGHINKYTASRKSGSSQTYEDTTTVMGSGSNGVGEYESSGTFNWSTDSPYVADRAQWEVALGTVPTPRYPSLSIPLHKAINATVRQPWLDAKLLSRIDVTALRATFGYSQDVASLILQGYGEHWNSKLWEITANCTPGDPYHVAELVDGTVADATPNPDAFRLYGVHSRVSGAVLAGASSMTVVTDTGSQNWTTTATYPNDFPLYIYVWGQIITVTAIVGAGQTQTFTLDPTTVLYTIPDTQPVYPYTLAGLGPVQVEAGP